MARDPRRSDPVSREGITPAGGQPDRSTLARLVVIAIVAVLVLVFVLQNNERVETKFLLFSVTTRLWVGLLATLVVGAFLGQAATALWNRRRSRD